MEWLDFDSRGIRLFGLSFFLVSLVLRIEMLLLIPLRPHRTLVAAFINPCTIRSFFFFFFLILNIYSIPSRYKCSEMERIQPVYTRLPSIFTIQVSWSI